MKRRVLVVVGVALLAAAWPSTGALAHPLGNFTVNRYSGIHVDPQQITVDYVVDLAEIPTFQEISAIDTNGDGVASQPELAAWAQGTAAELTAGIVLTIDDEPVPLVVRDATARLLNGQGDLSTLRFEGDFVSTTPTPEGSLAFTDTNDPDRLGWREITAVGQDGSALSGSTVPAESASDALRSYPEDLLSSPLDVRSMTASFAPGQSVPSRDPNLAADTEAAARPGVDGGPFASLLSNEGFALVALGLVLAVAFGAWHALLPGHGKTLMAAYMVGSKARARQAVSVGSAVAVMHTASVLALGLLVLTLERTFRPERVYPWLGLVSGLVALGLGAYLLISRLSKWGADQQHVHEHTAAGHSHALPEGTPLSPRGLMVLALAGGILPAPSALLVMLGAINAHRVGYGLALVLAFSVGLAAALIVIGMGALKARDVMTKRLSSTAGRLVPVLSAGAIVAVGGFLTLRGFAQI